MRSIFRQSFSALRFSLKSNLKNRAGLFGWISGFLLLLSGADVSQAGLDLNLRMYKFEHGYFAFPYLSTNNASVNPTNTAYFVWGPTSSMTNGIHYELNPDNSSSGSSELYSPYTNFSNAIDGNWTLLVTNETSTHHYTFAVDTSALNSNSFATVVVTFPLNGASGVDHNPLFTWSGPTNWQGALNVHARKEGGFSRFDDLPASETSWQSPNPLESGTNAFRVGYITNVTSLVSISAPVDLSSNVFGGWSEVATTEGFHENQFVVGSTENIHELIAHYAFDDETDIGFDSSGRANHITGSSSFGFPEHEVSSDSISGDGAVEFFGFSSLAPPTNVIATIAGDMTASAWIKTTQAQNETDSEIGIVWADMFGTTNDIIPMSLVDNKLVFFTGSSDQTEDALFSETDINTGNYIHVAVSRSQASGEKRIYINGLLDAQSTAATGLLDAAVEMFDLSIGAGFAGYEGLIDDLQIYRGILSAQEVETLFENPGVTIPDLFGNPLGHAVDAPNFTWTTGGDENWFSQTEQTHDGIDAAQAGNISENEQSWLRTTVNGPGTISFQWKMTDDFCGAQFWFSMDDFIEESLFCSSDWELATIDIPPGSHTLEWQYSKFLFQSKKVRASGVAIPQGAWLDEFFFTDQVAPHITSSPPNTFVQVGSNLVLTVELYANPEPSLQWFKNNVLIPGATNLTLTVSNAQSSDSGSYFMTASNHLGNAASSTAQVTVYFPTDLRPLSFTAPSAARGRIDISWIGTNTGPASISNWWDQVFITTNGTIITSLSANRVFPVMVIPSQGSYSMSSNYRLPPLPSGDYELLLQVDIFNQIIETNENNNTLSIPFTLPDVDIQLGNIQAASVAPANQTIQISWNTTNNGPGLIDGGNRVWDVGFFLSTDQVWDPNDFEFDNWGVNPPNLAAGEHFSMTVNTFLPQIASGNYFLILYADFDSDLFDGFSPGILFESNEHNNQLAFPIQITNPDLTPVTLLAPAGASPRQPIQIQWSIQNVGDALAQTANPATTVKWSDRLYLSTNGLIHPGAVQLGQFSGTFYSAQNYNWLIPLPVGETITNTQTIHIPNVAERDYFIVISNNYTSSVREFVRTNNSRSIPIRVGYPDLIVTDLTAPASADSREVIPVVWEVQNLGFGMAIPNWRDRVYLSTNDTYQTNDTFLTELIQTQPLGSGSNYLATNFVTVPNVPSGNYFLIVRTDTSTNLLESITNNNFRATAINLASPDLAVTQVNTITNVASQQAVNLTFIVTNLSGATAPPTWTDHVYLSTNNTFGPGDVLLSAISGGTDFNINTALPVSGSYTQEVDVRIPAVIAGNYFLLVRTDATDFFGEINEANNVFPTAIQLRNPDLKPTNFFAASSVTITHLNQRIEVGWNVLNQGSGTAHVGWTDYLYISTTNVLNASANFIGSQSAVVPLSAGQSYLAFDNPTLPNGLQGNYFLILSADHPNALFETSETNNISVRPMQIVIPPLADLSLTEVSGPVETFSGQEIEVTWILTNSGNATVTQPFRERLYLATSSNGSGAVNFGTFDFTGALAPGQAVQRIQRFTTPISMSGLRWPMVTTDINNEIFEFNRENNNTLVSAQPIDVRLSPFPNLTVTNVTSPSNAFSSQQTVVSWAVTNTGTGATRSPYWYDAVYLSTDAVVGNDTHLANVGNVSYLNPGESYVSSATVNLPRGIQGTYYFIIRTDAGSSVFESTFENDNVTISPSFFIDLTPPPDLRVTALITPLNAFSSQSASLTWAVTNAGQGQTLQGSWSDRVYLSTDTNLSGNDFSLGSFNHLGALEPGRTYRVTNSVALPTGISGDYYFIVVADGFNNVFEVPFENNNLRPADTVTAVSLTPPPDLEATIQLSPTNALSSHVISVLYRVANNGATVTYNSHWVDRLFVSSDNVPSGDDLQLSTLNHYGNLNPGASYTNLISAILPDTLAGVYYLFVTADMHDQVFELDNTNNTTLASNTVEIISRPADLMVRTLQGPSTAQAGGAMFVSWSVTNIGTGDSAITIWNDRLILSADDFLGDSDDINLKDRSHNGLLGFASEYSVSNEVVSIPISVSPGIYRLFVTTDRYGNVFESDETNNVFGPVLVTITRDTADLQITNIVAPASGISGTSFTVQWNVQNFGTSSPNAGSWVDGVYLSLDNLLSPSDLHLGRRQNPKQIAPGATYTNSLSATLPANLVGDYFVIVVTDEFNQVVESGLEGNNLFATASAVPITLSPVPDLEVSANAPTEAFSGQIFDLDWTVQNVGNAPAKGSWYEAAYLSLDHFLDPFTDIYLGYRYQYQPPLVDLAPGESYTNHQSFQIPQGVSGPYFVFVSADTGGHIFERNSENNNIAFDPQAMVIQLTPPVDLVAGPMTIPANAAPGVNATITYTVFNFGSNTARGSWEDAIYISADTNFDAGDSLMGRVRHRGDVLAGSNYTETLTAPLPGVLPGDYHVLIRSDILNHIPESNETNNLGASLNSVDIDAEELILGTADTGMIDQGQSVFYKFNATAGQTVRIRFTTGVALAGNEIFVRHAQMPSRGQFDFAINEPFVSDPDIFIPIEHTGTHYLLVYSGSMPIESSYSILAEVLPFSVANIFPNIASDQGETTFKIKGALFDDDSVFQLIQNTTTIPAARFMLEDSSTAYVTFNLVTAPNGPWNLKAFMNSTSIVSSTLSNAITVTSGGGGAVSFAINGPLSVWAVFTQRILAFYGNEGDSDVTAAPLILLSGRDGTRVGTQVDGLRTNVLQLLGRSLDGPAQTLRPQSSHSHTAYYRGGGLHVQGRTVSASDLHPITENEWLEIESSVRPTGIEDVNWFAFWSNIRPRVGPTWGDYVKFLNRFAEPFPAEQRDVREMFAFVVTNQPNFRASSALSGVLLNSTNDAPLSNLEVAFFSVNTNGAISVGGTATSDNNGQFYVPSMPAGKFVASIVNDSELEFDMDQDGIEDENAPTFLVSNETDLLNQTIYLTEPAPRIVVTNDADATLVLDSQNVLHSFWFRNDLLWHSRNDNGNWVDAAPISTNRVNSFSVSKSAVLINGSSPGLIVVWTQKETNRVDLHYSVGQSEGSAYTWSAAIKLTDDLVQNISPAVTVRDNGLALVSYLKRGVEFRDDTDLYFSVIDVASGNLLRNDHAPASIGRSLDLGTKQSFGWSKDFKMKPLGLELEAVLEASGELTTAGCEAGASFKIEGSATVERGDYTFNLKGTGEGAFGFNVDPDQCEWIYKEDSASANVGLTATFGAKNIVFKVLNKYPPTTLFSSALEEFVTGFGKFIGFELENTLEIKIAGGLQGLHWDSPPADSFGIPKASKAEISVGGALKFGATYDNEIMLVGGESLNDGLNFKGESSVELALKAQIYPKWDFLGGTLTPSFSVQVGSYKWAVPLPELVWADEDAPAARSGRSAPSFALDGVLTWDPAFAFGTTNVYGTNSVVENVNTDLLNDGSPALAIDAGGVPYQIWYHDIDPFNARFGSELMMATFNGVNWTVPSAIPDSDGFNSQVSAATDAAGHRMAIWVHGDGRNVSTNMTFQEFFSERRAVDVHYAIFNGATWSAPQPITITDGPDSDLQLSYLANGDVLAVWTYTETNSLKHLVSSRWNGTTWSAVEQIASGDLRTPTAQQNGGNIYLIWTRVDRDNPDSPAVSLYQSINAGGSWGTPALFAPDQKTPSLSLQAKASKKFNLLRTRSLAGFVFGEIPKYCCKCKGKTTSVTNEPPTECGVSFSKYDYEKCQKIYEYKACPLVSSDPNDIVGPVGFGPERWVGVNPLNYVIRFENDALAATAPAKVVIITLPMDEDFDARTFRLGNFGFGDISVDVPANQAFYSTRLDRTATKGIYVDFFAGVDVAKREAFWRLTTIDPATGTLPINPLLGFLPPNNNSPEGEGFVSFSLKPNVNTPNGARVDATATIVFDTQPPIDTPPIFNSIETGIPVSAVAPLPPVTFAKEFNVSWSGNDGTGESGIAFYDVYFSENGGEYFLLAEETTLASIPFIGEYGSSYAFYSVAHDNAGNIEAAPLSPDTEILVATSNTPPTLLNFTNAIVVEKTLFTRQIEATDSDLPANLLTFELLNAKPGLLISSNGLFSWTPSETQGPTTNIVTIKVSDDGAPSLSATNEFIIVVLETNEPPVFLSAANYTVNEESLLTFTNDVVDLDIPTNNITLQLISAPTNATLDAASGVVTWTPTEHDGGTTNQIIILASDNASPSATTLRTNTIIVAEANVAPILDAITNRTSTVLSLIKMEFSASDSDIPADNFTFSLGSGTPGSVNPQTGVFEWKPGLEFGGTSNVLTAIVTDDGVPSLSTTQQFVIAIEDFVQLKIGDTALLINQTSSVPITANSSASWQTMKFTLQLPTNLVGGLELKNIVAPSTAASVVQLDSVTALITFSNAPGQELQGSQQLAQLSFNATALNSAVVNLISENQQTKNSFGEFITHLPAVTGRITIIGERPVLDAISLVGNRHSLLLFGNPGQSYLLETTTNLTDAIPWEFFTNVSLTNIVQPVEGRTNSTGQMFYRAR